MKKILSDRYFLGRKCVYCDNNGLYKLRDNRIKCKKCDKKYSIAKLKHQILMLYYFYLELSAKRTSDELGLKVTREIRPAPILDASTGRFID